MECRPCPNYVLFCACLLHVLIMCFSVLVFCRQQGNSFYLRHQRSGCRERCESSVPWGRALHLWLQPSGSSQRPPERLAMGRLRGQRQLRLPFRPGVRGRPRAREELPSWIGRERTHAYESTEQWSWENGEERNTHIDDWPIDTWKLSDSGKCPVLRASNPPWST